MDRRVLILLAALAGGWFYLSQVSQPPAEPDKQPPTKPCPDGKCPCPDGRCPIRPPPEPKPEPRPEPKPEPKKPRRPWGENPPAPVGASVGGPVHADGTEIQCSLPEDQHCRNVSSRGQGCCVQTSINHAARYQHIPALIDFHRWVQQVGLPGGAYPGAVDQRIPRCCKDRGYPVVPYLQATNADKELLIKACKSGRMLSVTYSKSPTGRYGGSKISHMVSAVHADEKWIVILDNNYPGSSNYEWVTWDEFKRVCNLGGPVWCVILLNPGGPPNPYSA